MGCSHWYCAATEWMYHQWWAPLAAVLFIFLTLFLAVRVTREGP